jgi:formamidopyrimidine-DNA glycosylase
MPELPDVEVFRKYWEKHAQNKKITDIQYGADRVIKSSPSVISRFFKGTAFIKTKRVGKHLFAGNDDGKWLRFHFGMTGYFDSGQKGDEFEYGQLVFTFQDDSVVAYINKRKLGNVKIVDDPGEYVKEEKLGPDAMDLSLDDFRNIISEKSGTVKGTLMNQNTISGLGNVYTDEILYQARIHPEKNTGDLDDDQIKEIHKIMLRVIKTAIRNEAQPDSFPDHYLTGHRKEGAPCPACGGKIEKITVSGRSTYFCPSCQ